MAKARLNLSDYFESASEKDVSFRLKLHPESSKVSSASVDLTIRKSVNDPTKQNGQTASEAICLDDDETGSLGDERLLAPNTQSYLSSPCNSIKGIQADDLKPRPSVKLDAASPAKDQVEEDKVSSLTSEIKPPAKPAGSSPKKDLSPSSQPTV